MADPLLHFAAGHGDSAKSQRAVGMNSGAWRFPQEPHVAAATLSWSVDTATFSHAANSDSTN
jgi:hypothetical protein